MATAIHSAATGAVAGIAASWAMTRFHEAASGTVRNGRRGRERQPPSNVQAAEKLSILVAGEPLPRRSRAAAGKAVHYGFGAVLGAAYGVGSRTSPEIRAGLGMPYGAAISLLVDELLVPAAGLSRPPHKAPLSGHIVGIASHLVFGAALEAAMRAIESYAKKGPLSVGAPSSGAAGAIHPIASSLRGKSACPASVEDEGRRTVSKPPESGPHSDIGGVHQDERPNVETALESHQTAANLEFARLQSKGRPQHTDKKGREED